MAHVQQATMDPLQMIMQAADRVGNAVVEGAGAALGFAAQHTPGAIGATVNACVALGNGVNESVRSAAESIAPSSPAASASPFAGLNLDGALAGFRGVSMGAESASELGQLASPLCNMAQMRQSGFSMAI